MLAGTIYNQLITTLENNATLSKYINNVFKGVRYNIEPASMPCIMVEPVQNNETEQDLNEYKKLYFSCDIVALTYCASDMDKAIVGNDVYKGVLDIENDIRACLIASNTLGDRVIDIRFDPTSFDQYEDKYPVRGLLIPIRILYQQYNVT